MFLTQCPKERNKRETFQRTVFFKQRPRDNVQEKLSKELCSRKEQESKVRFKKKATKQIEEIKLAANEGTDKTENDINEIEEMKLAAKQRRN